MTRAKLQVASELAGERLDRVLATVPEVCGFVWPLILAFLSDARVVRAPARGRDG